MLNLHKIYLHLYGFHTIKIDVRNKNGETKVPLHCDLIIF